MLDAVAPAEDELGRIDAVAGDGDHGRGMVRGLRAAVGAGRGAGDVPGQVLMAAGAAWAEAAGGASGALWGRMLQSFGWALVENGTGAEAVGRALTDSAASLVGLGSAKLGDKTMLDVLAPFVDAYLERAQRETGDCGMGSCATRRGRRCPSHGRPREQARPVGRAR